MDSQNKSNNKQDKTNMFRVEDKFKNLKSDYFLIKLFNNLTQKKSLEIIKYNNNIKRRLNININDYKEYSETYSSIEIEIIPIKHI